MAAAEKMTGGLGGTAVRPEQMSAKQVAVMHNVDVTTIYRWVQTGKLRAMRRAGRQYVIDRRDAEAMVCPVEPGSLPPQAPLDRGLDAAILELRRRGFDV